MSYAPKDPRKAISANAVQEPRSEGETQAFQSLAEHFENADDEVRRIEGQIAASIDQLGCAKVKRLALLQEIARMIGVSPKVFD